MNAPNPLSTDKRNAERKAHEPSMEEILASIRRIIADDQAFAQRPSPAPRTDAPNPLSEPAAPSVEMAAPSPGGRPFAKDRVGSVIPPATAIFPVEAQFQAFKTAGVPPAAAEPPFDPAPYPSESAIDAAEPMPWPPEPPEELDYAPEYAAQDADWALEESVSADLPLVSPQTDAAVASSFNALIASQVMPSGEDLNDMVREMLRPMLKAWLDDNLPVLVERLVRAEIERVARGGR